MPCQDKTSLLCVSCETVEQCARVFCLCVGLCSCVQYQKKESHTHSACRCFDISCDLSAVSFGLFVPVLPCFSVVLRTSVCLP